MYTEYKRKDSKHWVSYGGRLNPGRNYFMFQILAGVRGEPLMYEPKGLPTDTGYSATNDNLCYISEDSDSEDRYVTPENAAKWVANGSSKYVGNGERENIWVTNPDWHSHSWLATEEFEKAVNYFNENADYRDAPYYALLASMKEFEKEGYDCRVVFWFDN